MIQPLRLAAVAFLLAGLTAVGCSSQPPPPATSPTPKHDEEDDHNHDREKMLPAHAGKYHLWLTAHLSAKTGHELDVFVETAKDDKPAAIPVPKFTAKAKREGDEKEYDLVFEPAPADERKDDPPGAYSHYVAKAPWLKPDDVLTISAEFELDGRIRRPRWKEFVPAKYAHHVE